MKLTRKHFTYGEKAEAVKQILSGNKSRADIKKELGVKKTGTITIWINDYLNNRDKYINNKDKYIESNRKTKVCAKCGRKLSVNDFWSNNSKSDGLQSYCKECMKLYFDKPNNNPIIVNKSISDKIEDLQKDLKDIIERINKLEIVIG